jgi:hypothetical protein
MNRKIRIVVVGDNSPSEKAALWAEEANARQARKEKNLFRAECLKRAYLLSEMIPSWIHPCREPVPPWRRRLRRMGIELMRMTRSKSQ